MDVLRVEYDVTGLDQAQIDALAGEATVQAESSDDHPGVPVTSHVDHGVYLDGVLAAALAELDAYGASDLYVSRLTKLEARAVAHTVRLLGGCTGGLDDHGVLVHDGDTCPIHEEQTRVVVHLSGADVIGIDSGIGTRVEVRQHHVEYMGGLNHEGEDGYGRYEVEAVSAAAPVTAGPPPGPPALTASAVYRGVTGTVEILDSEDHEQYVVVRLTIDPTPPGLDRVVYSHQSVRAPEGPHAS